MGSRIFNALHHIQLSAMYGSLGEELAHVDCKYKNGLFDIGELLIRVLPLCMKAQGNVKQRRGRHLLLSTSETKSSESFPSQINPLPNEIALTIVFYKFPSFSLFFSLFFSSSLVICP